MNDTLSLFVKWNKTTSPLKKTLRTTISSSSKNLRKIQKESLKTWKGGIWSLRTKLRV